MLAAALVQILVPATRAAEPPGTPQPSRGAPGAQTDPFGTAGGEAHDARGTEHDTESGVLEAVQVVGGGPSSERSVRAHLPVREGDVLTVGAMVETRARLLQLGIFSRVEVGVRPGTTPGRAVLVVDVEERGPVTFAGFTLAQTPVSRPYVGLEAAHSGLLADTFGVSLGGAVDANGRRTARITLYAPDYRARGRSWIGAARAIAQDGLESGCATPRCDGHFSAIPWVRYRRAGGELDGGFRPGALTRFLVGWRLEALRASSGEGVVPEARVAIREGRSRLSALVLAFDLDSRTDTFLPSRGWRLEATATIGTAAIGSDYEYSRYLVQAERWFPRGGGRALRLDAAVGLVQGDAPFFERFYQADWSYFSVGLAAPRVLDLNFSPDSRYDALLAVLGTEYDLPLWTSRGRLVSRGVLALGARVVLATPEPAAAPTLVSQVPVSLDAALRLDTRYGVFAIGLGYAVDQILKAVPLRIPAVQRR